MFSYIYINCIIVATFYVVDLQIQVTPLGLTYIKPYEGNVYGGLDQNAYRCH